MQNVQGEFMGKILALLIMAVAATGCSSFSLPAAITGMRLAPLELDPEGVEFLFAVPRDVVLQAGDAKVVLAYAPIKSNDSDVVKSEIGLQVKPQASGGEFETDFVSTLYRARIPADQLQEFRNTQGEIRELKSKGIDGVGTFSVRIHSACYREVSPESFLMSAWIRSEPEGPSMLLTDEVDLWEVLGTWAAADLQKRVQKCE